MKLQLILGIFLIQEALSFMYTKENRYNGFLRKYSEITNPEVSGIQLKIHDETVEGLVDKLMKQVGNEAEVDRVLFDFGDDTDDFEEVDLTKWDEEEEDTKTNDFDESSSSESTGDVVEDARLSTSYGKWSCAYTRVFTVSHNGTKDFYKAHESTKEGGKFRTNVQGTLDTGLKMTTTGSVDSGMNSTLYHNGKEFHNRLRVKGSVKSSETDKKEGKLIPRFTSVSDASATSSVSIRNKTYTIKTSIKSRAETFPAPFRIYLSLFETWWDVEMGSGGLNGTVRGEVTSRVVYTKKGKSLTRSTVRGYISYDKSDFCMIKMFKIKSHTWTRPASREEDLESDNADNSIIVDIGTYSKGRIYGRGQTESGFKYFSGTGVASYEKARVKIPKTGNQHEYGIQLMVKSLMEKTPNWAGMGLESNI